MNPEQAAEIRSLWRSGSLLKMLLMCTDTTGFFMARMVSAMAIEVWEYPPAFNITAEMASLFSASCSAFMISPSILLKCTVTTVPKPFKYSSKDSLPYTSGSRFPTQLRLGPFKIRIIVQR